MRVLIVAGLLISSLCFISVQSAYAGAISDKVAQAENFASDSVITAEIKAKYLKEGELDSMDIKVKTVKGVVTLRGQVQRKSQAAIAVKIAQETKGVRDVVNKISVMP